MKLHIFNPENDLALADGGANYCPPPAAAQIAYDLASLPLWYADACDTVVLPGMVHNEYHERISQLFSVALPYDSCMQNNIISCIPWGWSPQIKRRLNVMGFGDILPSDDCIAKIRGISNRKSSITILKALQDAGFDTPPLPLYYTNPDDVAEFVNNRSRCVVKAPWSGSGKGIAWGIGRVETPMEHFYKGVIKRQGGVVCEEFLDGRVEFAMEFFTDGNSIVFAGYSLFSSFKGSYSGNVLASNREIENFLSRFVPSGELARIKDALPAIMCRLLQSNGYKGYFGIDMMIYEKDGNLRFAPCMELNLRMNMGMAARIFFDRHVDEGCTGEYRVNFFKKPGDAYSKHISDSKAFPLQVEHGKVTSGYLELSPVTPESRYSISVIIYKDKNIGQIYGL